MVDGGTVAEDVDVSLLLGPAQPTSSVGVLIDFALEVVQVRAVAASEAGEQDSVGSAELGLLGVVGMAVEVIGNGRWPGLWEPPPRIILDGSLGCPVADVATILIVVTTAFRLRISKIISSEITVPRDPNHGDGMLPLVFPQMFNVVGVIAER